MKTFNTWLGTPTGKLLIVVVVAAGLALGGDHFFNTYCAGKLAAGSLL